MFTSAEIRTALGPLLLSERPGPADSFPGISNDSRTLKPGELFVALQSETRDGHDFVAAAVTATGCLSGATLR
jgi:UDP-N-acetylmuramoyl-tripeptide--D-alanyl-D-alanine ligase